MYQTNSDELIVANVSTHVKPRSSTTRPKKREGLKRGSGKTRKPKMGT
jgi:hypothetical protein